MEETKRGQDETLQEVIRELKTQQVQDTARIHKVRQSEEVGLHYPYMFLFTSSMLTTIYAAMSSKAHQAFLLTRKVFDPRFKTLSL